MLCIKSMATPPTLTIDGVASLERKNTQSQYFSLDIVSDRLKSYFDSDDVLALRERSYASCADQRNYTFEKPTLFER